MKDWKVETDFFSFHFPRAKKLDNEMLLVEKKMECYKWLVNIFRSKS